MIERVKRKIRMLFPSTMSVDFVVCGAQKGGTSALDAYLREHPGICMADEKEVHYFDNDEYFSSGEADYSQYHSFFGPNKEHDVFGEVTPIYMYCNDAMKRIFEYNSNMKIIVLLRNPIERAYSHWNMERLRGYDDLSFLDAIKSEKERCCKAGVGKHEIYSYVDRGLYLEQLRRIWKYFPRDEVLIIKSEDLRQNPEESLISVCDFLGLSHFEKITVKDVHSRPYVSSMTEQERDYLRSIFESEIKELEAELSWDCSGWLG